MHVVRLPLRHLHQLLVQRRVGGAVARGVGQALRRHQAPRDGRRQRVVDVG